MLFLILLQATLTIAVSGPPTSPEYLALHVVHPSALLVSAIHRNSVGSISDLIGKRVGVRSPGAPEEPLPAVLLSRSGIRLNQVNRLNLGEHGTSEAPFLSSREYSAPQEPGPSLSRSAWSRPRRDAETLSVLSEDAENHHSPSRALAHPVRARASPL